MDGVVLRLVGGFASLRALSGAKPRFVRTFASLRGRERDVFSVEWVGASLREHCAALSSYVVGVGLLLPLDSVSG